MIVSTVPAGCNRFLTNTSYGGSISKKGAGEPIARNHL